MIRSRRSRVAAVLLGLATASACSAVASVPPNSAEFEVLAGYTFPGPDILDGDAFFGLRAGFNAGVHLYLDLELAFQNSDTRFTQQGTVVEVDYEAFVLDLSAGWTFATRKRWNPMLYGGLGWVNVTADVEVSPPGAFDQIGGLFDNSFSLHGGAGIRIGVTKGSYVRVDYRVRWFDERDDDPLDGEATLAYGWYF